MQNLKFRFVILILVFCILHFTGCTSIKEKAKSIAGISTKTLEEGRKKAIGRQFNLDYNSCFNKTEKILRDRGSYIYDKNLKKHMIAVYLSDADTTEVGIFFKEIDANNTLIEVSSPSTYAKETLAKRLFSALEGKPDTAEEKGLSGEKKQMGD